MYAETVANGLSEVLSHLGKAIRHVGWKKYTGLELLLSLKEMNLILSHLKRYGRPREPFDLHIRSQ